MKQRFFVPGDIDGFFGLFIDNLLQLMLIAVLCPTVAGLPIEWVTHKILPGAALSILMGNLFYAWQARRLARATGRDDVTALPFGINTPSLIAFIVLVMGPIYQETKNPTLVWQAGVFACLMSGVLETLGAFFGDWVRRHTPRAALLASLAGVALTFIAMGFIFQIFASPLIALVPMFLILATYGGRIRLPLGLPGGFVAVLLGTGLAWGLKLAGFSFFTPSQDMYHFAVQLPQAFPNDIFSYFISAQGWRHMAVIFPMALFNLIGSLQNLESAAAAGDSYPTRPSLIVNGLSSVVAAFLGSPFPTTIYIGHPAWKAMGARSGYSILNGVAITALCLVGGVSLILKIVPLEATLGILLWIGVVMTAQAFQETPKSHALAVAVGLIPTLAAWLLVNIEMVSRVAGSNLMAVALGFGKELYINGIIALSQGFLITAMILASIVVFFVERKFLQAAIWLGAAALLSLTGVIHAFELGATGVQNKFGFAAAPGFAAAYGLSALAAVALHVTARPKS
jgi:AGZA family xanthine/uracil permease-like MFS transporter